MAPPGTSPHPAASHALSTLATSVVGRVTVLLLSLLVARMLSPLEVGTLGLSVLMVSLISMLVSFPESAAVVLQPAGDDTEPALAGALASLAGTGALCAAVRLALGPVAAALGGDADGTELIRSLTTLLLWQPVLESLGSYPRILLRRGLDLGYLAGLQVLGGLLFAASAGGMLGLGLGQKSVVWGQLLGTATTTVLLWRRCFGAGAVRPRVWPGRSTWSALAGDSLRLMSGGVGGYISERFDNVLVAGVLGPAKASFYTVAWNLARVPVYTLSQVVYGVVVPTAAAHRADAGRLSKVLGDTFRFSCLLLSLAGSTLFFFGPALVEGLLGSKWRPLGPVLRVLAFSILAVPVQFAAGTLLVISRRAHIIGLATAAHLATEVLLIPPLTARWGVVGAAYADVAGMALVTTILIAGVVLGADPPEWLRMRPFAAPVVAAALAGTMMATLVPAAQSSFGAAIVATLATLPAFLVLTSVLGGRDTVGGLVSHVRQWLKHVTGTVLTHG